MLSRVTAKNVGDVFLRHNVDRFRTFVLFTLEGGCKLCCAQQAIILVNRVTVRCACGCHRILKS